MDRPPRGVHLRNAHSVAQGTVHEGITNVLFLASLLHPLPSSYSWFVSFESASGCIKLSRALELVSLRLSLMYPN